MANSLSFLKLFIYTFCFSIHSQYYQVILVYLVILVIFLFLHFIFYKNTYPFPKDPPS